MVYTCIRNPRVGVPTLDEFISFAVDLVQQGNEGFIALNASASDKEWLIGSSAACGGLSAIERATSSNPLCSNALLTNVNSRITAAVSSLTELETEGLAGMTSQATPAPTTAPGSRHRRETDDGGNVSTSRSRRATCTSRPDPYAIWTDFDDVKGPYTTDPADYRIRRQLVVLMQFADHTNRAVPSRSHMDNLMNCRSGTGCNVGSSTSGVRDYFLHQSYYRADTVSTVTDWVTINQTEAYTSGPGDYGKNTLTALSHLCGAMQQALTNTLAANPTLDLNDFVHDCDHKNQSGESYSQLKEVLFFHSGYPAEFSSSASANRIWSHRFQFASLGCVANSINEYTNPVDGETFRMPHYLVTNGCYGDGSDGDSCPGPRLGVIAHEMGHSNIQGKSVADFYEVYDGQTTLPSRCNHGGSGKGIDAWGLMGDSWGACGDQKYPPSMTAWAKMEMGWITPADIQTASAQTFDLYRSAQCPSALRVNYNFAGNFGETTAATDTEFLVVEYRQKSGHDSGLPGEGMVVYHLDLDTGTGGANRRPSYATDPLAHYYLRIEQSDGKDGLECGADADSGDAFGVGSSITSKSILSSPYRSSRGYQDSTELDTGITLRVDTTANDGKVLRVQYTTPLSVNPNLTVIHTFPTTCLAGQYGRVNGTCGTCPVGKYSAAGSPCISGCQICPDGTYADSVGSAECVPCPSGTYDDIAYYPSNSSSCKTCPSTTSLAAFGAIPGKDLAFEYCRNGGQFDTYIGGAYAEYSSWTVDCGSFDLLFGLSEEEWMMVIYAAIVAIVVLIVVSQFWHTYSRRRQMRLRKHHRDLAKAAKARQVRAGHGYTTYAPGQQVHAAGKAVPPKYDARGKKLTPQQAEHTAKMRAIDAHQRAVHTENLGYPHQQHSNGPPPGYTGAGPAHGGQRPQHNVGVQRQPQPGGHHNPDHLANHQPHSVSQGHATTLTVNHGAHVTGEHTQGSHQHSAPQHTQTHL